MLGLQMLWTREAEVALSRAKAEKKVNEPVLVHFASNKTLNLTLSIESLRAAVLIYQSALFKEVQNLSL